ncbi:hypothetical protein [Acidovorax carolinensis]|uniref:hypothetical protein n=1 Tax=Acidovorax carolinensis TaxID=553814 RepID=UPI003002D6C2
MLKKILALVAMLYAAASFAAVDVNKATAAELDGIKGIGPACRARSSKSASTVRSRTGTTSSSGCAV